MLRRCAGQSGARPHREDRPRATARQYESGGSENSVHRQHPRSARTLPLPTTNAFFLLEREPRRVAARVAVPVLVRELALDVTRTYQQEIAALDLDVVFFCREVE